MKTNWHGVYPAACTFFKPDYQVDFEATAKHLEMLIKAGVHGLIVLGSVGENTALNAEEKLAVLRMSKEVVAGRVPLLTGVAEFTTATAARFAAEVEKIGLDGLMVLPAMVYKADQREILAHFRGVAQASGLPVMIYNNPPAYSADCTPEMFLELADEPRITAIKESSDNPRRITDLRNVCGNRYILFSGVDDLVLESALLGAEGWVSGLVNAFPNENRVLWELAMAGRWELARELYRWYTPLLHLDTKIKLVQYIKMCVAELGLGSELTRPPRLVVEGDERTEVLGIIRKAIATRPNLSKYN
jgi:1-pyrroline-4-hydroxy-2-carboxylate deaminase